MNKFNLTSCPFCSGRDIGFTTMSPVTIEAQSHGVGYCYCKTCLARGPYVTKQTRSDDLESLASEAWNGTLKMKRAFITEMSDE